jgi:hypothetical protein
MTRSDAQMPSITGQSPDPAVPGVFGGLADPNTTGDGVFGEGGDSGRGVVGVSKSHTGVEGSTKSGIAVFGGVDNDDLRHNGRGVVGVAQAATGVEGHSVGGAGVWGSREDGEGVHAETTSPIFAAIAGFQNSTDPQTTGAAIYGKREGRGGWAGYFDGNVVVTGSCSIEGQDVGEAINSLEDEAALLAGQILGLQGELAALSA